MSFTFRLTFLLITLLCSSCCCIPTSGNFSGTYVSMLETSEFIPADEKWTGEKWWLTGDLQALADKYMVASKVPLGYGPVYIEVNGALSAKGRYGHLGKYDRELQVDKVLMSKRL